MSTLLLVRYPFSPRWSPNSRISCGIAAWGIHPLSHALFCTIPPRQYGSETNGDTRST